MERVVAPSSIAAFGPETPREPTPNDTIQKPNTLYGIAKVFGELLGNYYSTKVGLDVRGLRLPGIVSCMDQEPTAGTTDYAVLIFFGAIREKRYTCFLKPDTRLPMMYMPDAIKAIIDLAEADFARLEHHADFNVAAMSFTPAELAGAIRKRIPEFEIDYEIDPLRQAIADSWPRSLDDSAARREWGWEPGYDIDGMVDDMLDKMRTKLQKAGEIPPLVTTQLNAHGQPVRKTVPPAWRRALHSLLGTTFLLAGCTRTGPPFSPQQALETFVLEEGFRIEVFAAEPLIRDPVAMEIDEQGRVYVVEMIGYPLDTGRNGQVKLLDDTDGDGWPDRGTVFADGLMLPTGVLRWKQGVLVTDAPDVWYLEDTDGDNRADVKTAVLTGFALTNPQHTVSNPRYGLDNWIYLAHEPPIRTVIFKEKFGDEGSMIRFAGPGKRRSTGEPNRQSPFSSPYP